MAQLSPADPVVILSYARTPMGAMQGALAEMPAETLALAQVVQITLLWSERAFAERSPLAIAGETVILRPEIAGVLRAAYDPVLPPVSRDPSTALRLAARLGVAI